jgi:molybdopterin-dependent oxidoreductase alpha subunit
MKAMGGFRSIWYVLKKAHQSGGLRKMWKAMRSPNACKTCALGMGGQRGGMENEAGKFPEFCKKSVQAMAADMQGAITPEFFEQYSISQLASMSPRELESCGRLVFPMIVGPLDLHYKPISWDEALAKISASIRDTDPQRSFYYCSGRSSNEAGFLLQLAARIRGTNNINNCSYYCHQASGVGLSSITGSGTATVVLDDLEKCDLMFLIGCNPSSNHPRLLKNLIDLRRRGGKVIVINPIREQGLCKFKVPSDLRSLLFGSKISDLYMQPNIGGDSSLLLGMIKWLVEHDGLDKTFIDEHTDGFEDVTSHAESIEWDWIEEHGGVSLQTISQAASMYMESKSTIFCWAMGITHNAGGVDTVRMIANTAIARGMIGRRGAGLLPLRGHSNVQGIGSVGVVPVLKEHMKQAIEEELGVTLPSVEAGFRGDTMACMEASHAGDVDLAVCLGGNLFASNPDSTFAVKAMSKINLVSYMSTTLNQGHVLGRGSETIVLPVIARDEESQVTTQESMFNYVRRSSGGVSRHQGPRSEVDIIVELARSGVGVIGWEKYQDYDAIRTLMARCMDGFDAEREHQVGGRTFHEPLFNTPNGRAQAHAVSINPPRSISENKLRLMTIRSEGQFNTVVYEEEDIFRKQTRRDIVMMHAGDIERLGLQENDHVTVRGTSGDLDVVVRRIDIAIGNCAMYYPEANILLSHDVDAESRTPLFNGELIQILERVDAPK